MQRALAPLLPSPTDQSHRHLIAFEQAVQRVLQQGLRTADIYEPGTTKGGTAAMGDAVLKALN